MNNKFSVGLDIGTTKIVAMVGEKNQFNKTINYVQRLKDDLKQEHLIEAAQKSYESQKRLEKFLET